MTDQLHVPYRSISDMFLQRVAATPQANAFAYPFASGPVWLSWQTVGERASIIAAGLHSLGVQPEDRVAIAASTRIEWILADLGILCAGAATTTIYPTTDPKDAVFILRDSGSKILVAEDSSQVDKVTGADLPGLTHIVVMDGEGIGDTAAGVPVLTLAELERRGTATLATDPELVTRIAGAVRPDQLATLMYTSGTTGTPKGVELLHGGWCWEGVAQSKIDLLHPDDLQYLWLPLSHSFAKALICGIIHVGTPTYVDGRVDKIADGLATVRPTLMCGAPRIYEKVYNRIVTTAKDAGGLRWAIFQWAFRVGRAVTALQQQGREPGALLRIQRTVADTLVFAKIRARLGGQIKVLVSGAAPLSREISEFYHAAGLTIYEGYGLTETSAGAFINRPDAFRLGTVGKPLSDLEVRIADDGEIELRGVPVMRGYHSLPEETNRVFTPDGFLRTGDIGHLDADGFLTITDRKKDLIKTSSGKYVAPTHLENELKALCPYISHVLVIGQARNFVTMVLTLDAEAITMWAADGPLAGKSYQEIVTSPQAHGLVSGYLRTLNERLNRWETVKRFTILPRDLTVETGELTPSLKIKRRTVETAFASDIDKMYEGTLV